MSDVLAFRGVESGYGEARVLHGVDLSVGRNERVAILGRNGAGKTTVVNTLHGVATLCRGEVCFNGRPARALRHFTAAREGVAVALQGRRIIANLTVRENLLLGAAVRRPGQWNLERVFELFPMLRERANTPGTALSGGQQQMLSIGRALMANPALLVLDEPSEGLAPVIVDEFAQVLLRLAAAGTGLLLIEQNFSLVRRVVERYYVLSKGQIVDQGDLAGLSMESLKKHVAV
ncbi:MAG: ABC transporter ATP-binding protein [Betaproteobacteria bacterium]|nr:ABC transporter ATP-binding protein [Betaproteobacteria bacterium]